MADALDALRLDDGPTTSGGKVESAAGLNAHSSSVVGAASEEGGGGEGGVLELSAAGAAAAAAAAADDDGSQEARGVHDAEATAHDGAGTGCREADGTDGAGGLPAKRTIAKIMYWNFPGGFGWSSWAVDAQGEALPNL